MIKDHPISDLMMATEFVDFMKELSVRLRAGADSYGDSSFSRSSTDLLDEISQELTDVCGWSFVLHCRIQYLKRKMSEIEERCADHV